MYLFHPVIFYQLGYVSLNPSKEIKESALFKQETYTLPDGNKINVILFSI